MSTPTKYFTKFAFVLGLIFTLSTCKKYPENVVWFKNIKKIKFFETHRLIKYTVNGIDSLDALSKYIGSNSYYKDIRKTYFSSAMDNNKNIGVFVLGYGGGVEPVGIYYTYSKNKKEISFIYGKDGNYDTTAIKINIFIDETPWKIIKLIPDGTRKIKKTSNNNTYELQFGPF